MISYSSGRARSSFAPPETALRGRRPGDPGGTGETVFRYGNLGPMLWYKKARRRPGWKHLNYKIFVRFRDLPIPAFDSPRTLFLTDGETLPACSDDGNLRCKANISSR